MNTIIFKLHLIYVVAREEQTLLWRKSFNENLLDLFVTIAVGGEGDHACSSLAKWESVLICFHTYIWLLLITPQCLVLSGDASASRSYSVNIVKDLQNETNRRCNSYNHGAVTKISQDYPLGGCFHGFVLCLEPEPVHIILFSCISLREWQQTIWFCCSQYVFDFCC